jgi:hypothetical protein
MNGFGNGGTRSDGQIWRHWIQRERERASERESTCAAAGAGGTSARGGRATSQGQASRGPATKAGSVGSGWAIGGVVVHLDILVQPPQLHLAQRTCDGGPGLAEQGDREGEVGGLGVGGGVAGPGGTAR